MGPGAPVSRVLSSVEGLCVSTSLNFPPLAVGTGLSSPHTRQSLCRNGL